MANTQVKYLLSETYNFLNERYGVDVRRDLQQILAEDTLWNAYKESLAEGLEGIHRETFNILAENTRKWILNEANLTTGFSPYYQLVLPILRIFFPRLVAKEIVTVSPINAPEVVKYFLKAVVKAFDGSVRELPAYEPVSQGPTIPVDTAIALTDGSAEANLITLAGADPTKATLDRNLFVVKLVGTNPSDGSTEEITGKYQIDPATGKLTINANYSFGADTVLVEVDFQTGRVVVTSAKKLTTSVYFSGQISLETNEYNPVVELKLDKVLLAATSRKLSVQWSVELEQDVKALFDLDFQSEVVNLMAAQIATDIDNEIIRDIVSVVTVLNPSDFQDTFNKTMPAGYAFGPKQWLENIVVKLNTLSSKIQAATNIGPANIIAVHPEDASILYSLNDFKMNGDYTAGGDLISQYRTGTLVGQYKVVVSPIIPKGKMILALKPDDERASCYVYAPYVPVTLMPYPLGSVPSLTIMSRYAKTVLRPQGFAILNIV